MNFNKKIYTSYYAKNCNNPLAIAISKSPPSYYEGPHLTILAPTWELIMGSKNGVITEEQFIEEYVRLLEERKVDPFKLIQKLPDNTILLCYEPPTKFCHRFILSSWIKEKTGFSIPEWKDPKQVKKEQLIDNFLEF